MHIHMVWGAEKRVVIVLIIGRWSGSVKRGRKITVHFRCGFLDFARNDKARCMAPRCARGDKPYQKCMPLAALGATNLIRTDKPYQNLVRSACPSLRSGRQ